MRDTVNDPHSLGPIAQHQGIEQHRNPIIAQQLCSYSMEIWHLIICSHFPEAVPCWYVFIIFLVREGVDEDQARFQSCSVATVTPSHLDIYDICVS